MLCLLNNAGQHLSQNCRHGLLLALKIAQPAQNQYLNGHGKLILGLHRKDIIRADCA